MPAATNLALDLVGAQSLCQRVFLEVVRSYTLKTHSVISIKSKSICGIMRQRYYPILNTSAEARSL